MSQLDYLCFALLGIFALFTSFVQGDIRCHCNQPACVRTGYMCKSKGPQAGCFVEHSGYVTVDRSSDISRHGCIEMLPTEERASCLDLALASSANSGVIRSSHHRHLSSHHGRRPTNLRAHNKSITCCLDDMCNYVKTIVEEDSYVPGSDQQHHGRHHHRRPVVVSNSHNFESLGRHLQELHGIDDSLQSETYLWLIPACILGLIIFFVMLIFFVIRYIRQDEEQNLCKKQKYSQKISTVSHLQMSNKLLPHGGKKPGSIMADWRNLMSPRRVNTCDQRHLAHGQSESGSTKGKQTSLLLSVKVDLNSSVDPSITKVVEDGAIIAAPTNLPNIISVHTLPSTGNSSSEEENFHSKETTFLSGSREHHNSIYMSLLSHNTPADQLQMANFDLISSANSKSMV